MADNTSLTPPPKIPSGSTAQFNSLPGAGSGSPVPTAANVGKGPMNGPMLPPSAMGPMNGPPPGLAPQGPPPGGMPQGGPPSGPPPQGQGAPQVVPMVHPKFGPGLFITLPFGSPGMPPPPPGHGGPSQGPPMMSGGPPGM